MYLNSQLTIGGSFICLVERCQQMPSVRLLVRENIEWPMITMEDPIRSDKMLDFFKATKDGNKIFVAYTNANKRQVINI